jgi:hypothetical protein
MSNNEVAFDLQRDDNDESGVAGQCWRETDK